MTNKLQINAKIVAHTRNRKSRNKKKEKNKIVNVIGLRRREWMDMYVNVLAETLEAFVCFCIIGLESKSVLMSSFCPATDDYAIHIFFQIRRKVSRSLSLSLSICSNARNTYTKNKKEEKRTTPTVVMVNSKRILETVQRQ